MSLKSIEKAFIDKVSAEISLSADGKDRYLVFTPFHFNDGDQLVIVLKKLGGKWVLSDEAHTFIHLSYSMDEKQLKSENRQKIILKVLSMFQIKDHDGELIMDVSHEDYGTALFDFVQALIRIIDVTYLSRDNVRSTFKEDFRALLSEKIESDRMTFDWQHPENDPDGIYAVDCRINGMPQPLFVFALNNDNKTQTAALTLYQFREWGIKFHPLGIFEKENSTSRNVRMRFKNVCQTHFTDIVNNSEEIEQYLQNFISNGNI